MTHHTVVGQSGVRTLTVVGRPVRRQRSGGHSVRVSVSQSVGQSAHTVVSVVLVVSKVAASQGRRATGPAFAVPAVERASTASHETLSMTPPRNGCAKTHERPSQPYCFGRAPRRFMAPARGQRQPRRRGQPRRQRRRPSARLPNQSPCLWRPRARGRSAR